MPGGGERRGWHNKDPRTGRGRAYMADKLDAKRPTGGSALRRAHLVVGMTSNFKLLTACELATA